MTPPRRRNWSNWRSRIIASCRSATSSGSIPFSITWKASPPSRASSRPTAFRPIPARSTDIGVVLDLMIHDLDVVLAFVKSPVASVDAVGIPVLSKSEDIANARLRFANGCVANLTVEPRQPGADAQDPRVQRRRDDQLHLARLPRAGGIHLPHRPRRRGGKLAAEEAAPATRHRKDSTIVSEFGGKRIVREPVPIAKDEPLKLELQHFVQCVREQRTRRWSAANRRNGRWTWRLKSRGRCSKANE